MCSRVAGCVVGEAAAYLAGLWYERSGWRLARAAQVIVMTASFVILIGWCALVGFVASML